MNGLEFYTNKIDEVNKQLKEIENKLALFSYIRGGIFIAFCSIGYLIYKQGVNITFILLELAIISIFIAVVLLHQKSIEEKRKINILYKINEMGIKRINGEFSSFEDDGEEFIDENNAFTNDLDVFGKSSLFQMINTTITLEGKKFLAEMLGLKREITKKDIELKQEGVRELGEKVKWRQDFYVTGSIKSKKNATVEDFTKWSKEKNDIKKSSIWVAYGFIAFTLLSVFLTIAKVLPFSYVILVLMVNYAVIKVLTKNIKGDLEVLINSKNLVKANARLLKLIEEEEFKSNYINSIKGRMNAKSKACTEEMKKISNIIDWIGDSKGNAYYFIINVLFFADIFIMKNLCAWRDNNRDNVEEWFSVIGELDALSSIANLDFDFKDWTYPVIKDEMMISGKNIRHPLIGERAKGNSYSLKEDKRVTLITGSNMSGKSTFLRTIGMNLLLSYIGAPTFTEEFMCGKMNIYTCMRTKDNLEESISSFYAEILRIKLLLEATKRGERVFFLLDEIFKGTNSKDRHTGATVLIKQLIKEGAIGLVSTHDLELCDLEETITEIGNYNFREYYEDDKIKFDYILRQGKSKTQNAIHLMRLAGIEFKDY